jgi:hypothetical protein
MLLNWSLFWWQFRQVRLITFVGLVVAMIFTLREPDPLDYSMLGWALLFATVHGVLIAWRLGRTQTRSFAFLYTQGYTRDATWRGAMLASAAAVLIAWLPSALAIWLGVRSHYQDALHNYWFPFMQPTEYGYPLWCLMFYASLLPAFHYAWIRQAQPTRGILSGGTLAVCLVIALFSLWNAVRLPYLPGLAQWFIFGGLALTSVSLLLGGWRLHRQLEVMS